MVLVDLDAQYTTFIQKFHFQVIKTKNWLFLANFCRKWLIFQKLPQSGDKLTRPTDASAHDTEHSKRVFFQHDLTSCLSYQQDIIN